MKFQDGLLTPAFVIDDAQLDTAVQRCWRISEAAGSRLLYSPKALAIPYVLHRLASSVDGFSCSSLNEVRVARDAVHEGGTIHLVTPGLLKGHLEEIESMCDF